MPVSCHFRQQTQTRGGTDGEREGLKRLHAEWPAGRFCKQKRMSPLLAVRLPKGTNLPNLKQFEKEL